MRGLGVIAERGRGADANDDVEGQHDGVFDGGRTIFSLTELDDVLGEPTHYEIPSSGTHKPGRFRSSSLAYLVCQIERADRELCLEGITFSDSRDLSDLMATAISCRSGSMAVGARIEGGAPAFWREHVYWVLPLALLPLAFSLGQPDDDTPARFRRTLLDQPIELRLRVELAEQGLNASLDDVLAPLPGQRIQGALLSRATDGHWLIALGAGMVMMALALSTFRSPETSPIVLIVVCLFTASVGYVILLSVEGLIAPTVHEVLEGQASFPLGLCAYILGVGLFEELAKALPILWRVQRAGPLRWRAACLWGLASGIGFGLAEGVQYSEGVYNGLASIDAYLVRFISCVALHAIWAASAAIQIARRGPALHDTHDPAAYAVALMQALAVPVVLHGVYDVLLQFQFHAAGLAVALGSFGWLAWQIESARLEESVKTHGTRLDAQLADERA